ncbi:hypothetical protein J4731_22400 [Providencia rettgeri]|nr:hypothetical protein [Providencia rettgeri]
MIAEFSSVDLTGFTPSGSLSNSVNSGDLSSARISLFMEMNDKHLSTKEIIQAIAWVLSEYPTLFVDYEENAYSQKMEQDETTWDSHYYHTQELYATSNFSSERILHMVAVRTSMCLITQMTLALQHCRAPSQKRTEAIDLAPRQLLAGSTNCPEYKPKSNILKSLLLIGGVVAAIALVILAVIV